MILDEMYANIDDRAKNPQPKSFTNKLLDGGVEYICKKVGEEASEVIIAAMKNNREELICEIADLVFMTLGLMYDRKVTPKDIENKLRERQKVTGNVREKTPDRLSAVTPFNKGGMLASSLEC